MAAIDNTRAQIGTGFFARINDLFTNAFSTLSTWNDARVTRNALSQLSDRELEDIGLCRGDIEYVSVR